MQRKKALITLAAIMTAASITACGSGVKDGMEAAKEGTSSTTESVVETESSVAETDSSVVETESAVEETDSSAETVTESVDPNALPADNPLAGIADPEEMRNVYDEIDALMVESYQSGPLSTETDGEKVRALEDELIQQVADAHGLTYDNVRDIYINGGTGALYNYDKDSIKILYGEFVEANISGTTLVVKAKIAPSFSNDSTINQNYFNVCDIIREQGGGVFHKISYWAVADMTSGEESKVISFDVPKDMIDLIATQQFADNTLGDYVDNLWVHPSLQ